MSRYTLLLAFIIMVGCDDVETKSNSNLGTWKRLNDFPAEGRNASLAFSIQGRGYWAFGANSKSSFLTEVWEYDPIKDTWKQKKDFPYGAPSEAVAVVNNKAYVLMYSGALYEYDPSADSWTLKSIFPVETYHNSIGFGLGSDAYFGAGNGGTPSASGQIPAVKSFWKYSVTKNTWTQIEDLPGAARIEPASFIIGNSAYVGVGFDGLGAPPFHTDFYRFDGERWHTVAALPETKDHLTGLSFASKDKGYIGVLMDGNQKDATVFEYDPGKNSWRKISDFPSRQAAETRSFLLNDRVFVIGGWWSEISSQVWEFVP